MQLNLNKFALKCVHMHSIKEKLCKSMQYDVCHAVCGSIFCFSIHSSATSAVSVLSMVLLCAPGTKDQ